MVRLTIHLLFIRQNNVVSLDLCINVYSGFIHFPLQSKRRVVSLAFETRTFWFIRIKPEKLSFVSTCLWVASYVFQQKEEKVDAKKVHCSEEINQYFDSSVTLAYANLSVFVLWLGSWQSVWNRKILHSNYLWISNSWIIFKVHTCMLLCRGGERV